MWLTVYQQNLLLQTALCLTVGGSPSFILILQDISQVFEPHELKLYICDVTKGVTDPNSCIGWDCQGWELGGGGWEGAAPLSNPARA